MDKNTLIGFILMGAIFFGFSFYQSKQAKKQAAYQAQLDSIALANMPVDTVSMADVTLSEAAADSMQEVVGKQASIYKDSLLEAAHSAEASFVTLENDELELVLTTRGGQPYSARLKNYFNYDSTALYIFRPGSGNFSVSLYTSEYVNTDDFSFEVASATGNEVVMRLPFASGGYIERKYSL